jgi:hypothetical protein
MKLDKQWYSLFIADRENPEKQEIDSIPKSRIRGID